MPAGGDPNDLLPFVERLIVAAVVIAAVALVLFGWLIAEIF